MQTERNYPTTGSLIKVDNSIKTFIRLTTMKNQRQSILGYIVSALGLMGVESTSHAQTRAEIEKAAVAEIMENNRKNAEDFLNFVKEKEAEKRGEFNKDPVVILKRIHGLLMDFESDLGALPSDDSDLDEKAIQSLDHLAKDSSNRYFAMLIAGGYCDPKAEPIFSLPFEAIHVKNADQNVAKSKLLEAGECSITYNRVKEFTDVRTPLALYPVTQGKTSFDAKAAGGKAYVLMLNGSVKVYDVAQDGSVMVDGKSFFDPTQPYWGGKMNLCYPMLKKP